MVFKKGHKTWNKGKKHLAGKKNPNFIHGLSKHPLYNSFTCARKRSTNKNEKSYKTYKGRWGKNTVAELTLHYLKEYDEFVKNNPTETPTIDRIDNDGKYEIGNIQIISRSDNIRKRNDELGNPAKHTRKPVEGLINGKWVKFASIALAGESVGVCGNGISGCCRGAKHRNTAGDYKWRYAV